MTSEISRALTSAAMSARSLMERRTEIRSWRRDRHRGHRDPPGRCERPERELSGGHERDS